MVTTRSSQDTRASNSTSPPPAKGKKIVAGSKRKSPLPTTGEDGDVKKQKTIEESMSGAAKDGEKKEEEEEDNQKSDKIMADVPKEERKNEASKEEEREKPAPATRTGDETTERDPGKLPSNILEKGLIYFFFRGRVGIDDPSSIADIARSYIVLRPLDPETNISGGPIPTANNARLIALPKKVLPKTNSDRFLIFVEKGKTTHEAMKEFMSSNDYETKTAGTRHVPAVTPAGEGVYALTETGEASGRTVHLAYMLTIPKDLGKVQRDLGLCEKGSFVASVRNPNYPSPPTAALPKGPEYPKHLLDQFRSLRWIPLKPEFLDYENSQVLLIGEGKGELGNANEQPEQDKEEGKMEPVEEIEKLEDEDEERIKGLKGDETDAIFEDLQLRRKEFPDFQTTW